MRSSEGLGVSKLTTTKTTRLASIPHIMGVFAKRPSRTIKITTTMESKALIAFGRVNILLHVTGVPCSARTFQR
jgi:hypothetical protein